MDEDNKTRKFHRLLKHLQAHPHGMALEPMAALLGVDKRTVKRYLAEIRRLGYALQVKRQGAGNSSLYSVLRDESSPTFLLPPLRRIRKELIQGGNPKHTPVMDQVISHFEARAAAERKGSAPREAEEPEGLPGLSNETYYIDHGPFAETDPPVGILKILEEAIQKRMAVRIRYSGYSRQKEDVEFFPYCLALRVGSLYLIGLQEKNEGEFRSLLVRRIQRCLAGRRSFERQGFDPAEFYRYCFGPWARQKGEKPETVRLRIRAPWLKKFLSESHFNPPGKWVERGADPCFELQVMVKPDFVNWVLSLAPDLLPLEPPSLKRMVEERLEGALKALQRG